MHESTKQFGSSKNKLSIHFFLTLSCVLDQKEKEIYEKKLLSFTFLMRWTDFTQGSWETAAHVILYSYNLKAMKMERECEEAYL